MNEILERLQPTYCGNCDIEKHLCSHGTKYCDADVIHAYEQGREYEREMIVRELERAIIPDERITYNYGLRKAIYIVRGGEKEQSNDARSKVLDELLERLAFSFDGLISESTVRDTIAELKGESND